MLGKKLFLVSLVIFILALIFFSGAEATARTYTTNFPFTENPIYVNGLWIDGSAAGTNCGSDTGGIPCWYNVETGLASDGATQIAYGLQAGGHSYHDATAILSGSWGNVQTAQATAYVAGSLSGGGYPELELRLHTTISSSTNTGYEICFACNPNDYIIIVRWDMDPATPYSFTYLDSETQPGSVGLNTGDMVKATIDGSGNIKAYKSINGGTTWTLIAQATDTTYATGSLGMGFNFEASSNAHNSYGFSAFSATDGATDVPGAPTGVSATPGNAQATVTFKAPLSDGGGTITGYTVTPYSNRTAGQSVSGPGSAIIVPDLTNGTAYTFTVAASNNNGTGPASKPSNSVTPVGVPGTPTNVTATAGNSRATVSFKLPSNGGGRITGYTVTSGNRIKTGAGSPITVTGLTNGTAYTFTVTATNASGNGSASNPSNTVTPGAPGAPAGVAAKAGNEQATVAFSAPVLNGGGAITVYTVTPYSGGAAGQTSPGSRSPIIVTGLTNGTAYTFTVTATNADGTGPASKPSNNVTPATVPDAPTNVTATAGASEATVTFTAPADNGYPITSYAVTSSPGGKRVSVPANSITVKGLTNGKAYTFTVRARNRIGTGPPSSPSNIVTPVAS